MGGTCTLYPPGSYVHVPGIANIPVQGMKCGVLKETTFWDFKRKLEIEKEEKVTAVIDKDGRVVEGKEKILQVCEEFYKDLFKVKVVNTKERRT